MSGSGSGTSSPLTADTAPPAFAKWLSSEDETPPKPETPPVQEAPEPESVEAQTSPEPVKAEDESETPETPPAADPETPESTDVDLNAKYRTKIDGEEIEVTLEEALKGYSRTQDYTRKTQALAEQRKQLDAELPAVRAERQKYAEAISNYEQALQDGLPTEPDWTTLQRENPAAFADQYTQWKQYSDHLTAVRSEREEAQKAVQADRATAMQSYLAEEHQKLAEALPEWKDPKVATAEKARLAAFAKGAGFTPEQLNEVTDHKVILLLRKAMLYDEGQQKRPAAAARIERVKAATPGSSGTQRAPVSDLTKARQRLAQTGKPEDLATAFTKMISGE